MAVSLTNTAAILIYMLAFAGTPAQNQLNVAQSSPPAFEVSVVRPSKAEASGGRLGFTQNRFKATATTLQDLIKFAYGVQDDQISGGPGWIRTQTYDVEAKIEGDADLTRLSKDQLQDLLKPLLADRFKLKLHEDSKAVPAYDLVVDKAGPRMKPYASSTSTAGKEAIRMAGRGHLVAVGVPMFALARVLSDQVGRPVTDATGLKGTYDFSLQWTPDENGTLSPQSDPNGPSIFTAVREQLGLKLERQKGQVGTLVIDSAEPPKPN